MASKDLDTKENVINPKGDADSHEFTVNQQLSKLNAAVVRISSAQTPQEIQDIVTEEYCKIFSASSCCLEFWDKEEEKIIVYSEFGPENREHLAKTGETYLLKDYPSTENLLVNNTIEQTTIHDPKIDPLEKLLLEKIGFNSLLMIPLASHTNVFGLIELYNEDIRVFTEYELLIAKLFSHHVAIALENAKLIMEMQRGFDEQKTLHKSALLINTSLDLNSILTKIAQQVCEVTDATSVYISSFDPNLKSSTVLADYYGKRATKKERVSDLGQVYYHEEDFSKVYNFMKKGKPIIYHHDDENLKRDDLIVFEKYGGKTVVEIPFKIEGEYKAYIEIWETGARREFSDSEISLCQKIASQAANAIENSKLYSNVQNELEIGKEIQKKLEYDVFHDPLTKLPNRTLFMDRLEQAIIKKKRFKNSNFAVIYIDLDDFKNVNDSYGHSEGDRILIQAGQVFAEAAREVDTVSRFGGDEFIILLEGPLSVEDVKKLTDRIQLSLNTPMRINNHEIILTASMGFMLSSQEYENAEDLIRKADIAMYHAKAKGVGHCEIYSTTKNLSILNKYELDSEMREAFAKNNFVLHYQPIIDMKKSKLYGFETLLRWQKNSRTLVYPGEFISVLEETGLIIELGYWIIEEACKQLMKWNKKFKPLSPLSLSINISSKQISENNFVKKLEKIIKKTGYDVTNLNLEISETILLDKKSAVVKTLTELQTLGVNLHLDDFGTGFTTLGFIDNLPVDSIKIDRLFINRIDPTNDKKSLVYSILSMADKMNLEVISVGIETEEQMAVLTKNGSNYGQGYYFEKGQNVEGTEKYLQSMLDKK